MLDLLITGATVIDGSGNPGFHAGVGVLKDKIHIIRGDLGTVEARRIIDATGHVVCPGFIDVHAHSGLMILSEPGHEPKIRQGVTTELIGVDGNSYAPFKSYEDFLSFVELNSGLDGNPALHNRWSTVAEYLSLFDKKVAVNIAYVVGNSPLRIATTGWKQRKATRTEQTEMQSILRDSMEEGAFGLSTGLDYPPGSYADTKELIELSRVAARLGGIYHSHVRYHLGDQFLDPFREAIEIGRQSGVPVHITHFYQRNPSPRGAHDLLDLVERGRSEGLDITFDTYPSMYGSTRLLIVFPEWAHDGGPRKLKEVLRSPEARKRLRREIVPRTATWDDMWLTYFKQPKNKIYEGRSIAQIAEMTGKGAVDAMCDLLLEEDLQTSFSMAGVNPQTLPEFVRHPLSMVGSDALLIGDYPSPRSYGCFATILGEFVRENRFMSLPEAIRKMTSFPAQRLGISDRGILRNGMKADITVFHPAKVKALSTRANPKKFPAGIEYVLVNGKLVIDQGEYTGALPGRALRHGHS